MNNKIIRVQPVPKYFSITWMLGSRCNYECIYCPPDRHDMTSRPHDLETMQFAWKNIHEKTRNRSLPYKIIFTGGEVTANKNFLPLISWMRENYSDISMILFTTNGSASLNYYTKLAALVESMSFSTHSEFMDEADFFQKAEVINALMVRPKKSFHVNIMDEYWNQDRIEMYKKWLTEKNITHSVNKIDYSRKTRDQILMKGTRDFERLIKS